MKERIDRCPRDRSGTFPPGSADEELLDEIPELRGRVIDPEEARMEHENRVGKKHAVSAIVRITGRAEDEVLEAMGQVGAQGVSGAISPEGMKGLFESGEARDILGLVRSLKDELRASDARLQSCLSDPVVSDLLNNFPSREEVLQALEEVGAPRLERVEREGGDEPIISGPLAIRRQFVGEEYLDIHFLGDVAELRALSSGRHETYHELLDTFSKLAKKGTECVAIYRDAFLGELSYLVQQGERSLVPLVLVGNDPVKQYRMVEKTNPYLLEEISQRLSSLQAVLLEAPKKADGLVRVFPIPESYPAASVRTAVEGIKALLDKKMRPSDVRELLTSIPEEERLGLLRSLRRNPAGYTLYRAVHRHGVTPEQCARFLLDEGDVSLSDGTSATNRLIELGRRKSQGKTVAFFVREGIALLQEESDERFFECIASYSEAHEILPFYQAARERGEEAKREAYLCIGKQPPEPGKLLPVLRAVSDMEAEALQVLLDEKGDRFVASLTASPKEEREPSSPPSPSLNRRGREWFSELAEQFAGSGATVAQQGVLAKLHAALPDSEKARIRAVWQYNQALLSPFCDIALVHHETEGFQNIMRDSALFFGFLGKLEEDLEGTTEALRKALRSGDQNSYRPLARWLLCSEEDLRLYDGEERAPAEDLLGKEFHYSRVIIWGGEYTPERRKKIEAALEDVPIVIHDSRSLRSDASQLTPSDLVIWITRGMAHSDYYGIRRVCRNRGVDQYHFSQTGSEPIIAFLRDLKSQGDEKIQ
ncbi:hypothetical protein MRY87_02825 [bacterium]|nr:hypothetical protein [bacterium]